MQHKNRAHALLSASSADRWINCTPSARMSEKHEQKESIYAREGTLAHELCELILQHRDVNGLKRTTEIHKECTEKEFDFSDMLDHAGAYAEYVLELFEQAKLADPLAELIIEQKVDLTDWVEDGFGTCDAIIVSLNHMDVIDFKYGQGVKVSPADNSQLKLYGLGALKESELMYNIESVELHIFQPRINHVEGWRTSADTLREWGQNTVIPAAKLAYEGKGECKAGHWCKFCDCKPTCRAAKEAAFSAIRDDFTDPKELSTAEIAEVLKKAEFAIDWLGSVKDYALTEAVEKGTRFEGFKLVEGRSIRKWIDEVKVSEFLSKKYTADQFTKTSLKGIGDIEKLVGKKDFPILLGDLVHKPEGKPTLVPENDKRPEWSGKATINDFDNEL